MRPPDGQRLSISCQNGMKLTPIRECQKLTLWKSIRRLLGLVESIFRVLGRLRPSSIPVDANGQIIRFTFKS
jgi:hypothetical protein